MSKKRNKNKHELEPFSGKKKRPPVKKRTRVDFEFKTPDGTKYKNGTGRLKISTDGGISCLIVAGEGFIPVKAELLTIKMVKYVARPKVDVSRAGRRGTTK